MEKREFLKGAAKLAALAPAGAIAKDTGRLFGAPASVTRIDPATQNKLRLAFARSGVPTDSWDEMLAFVDGLQQLDASEDARARFSASPSEYFERLGVRTGPQFVRSREMAMARLAADTAAKQAARSGDYITFMQKVKQYNLPVLPDASVLTNNLIGVLRKDKAFYESVRSIMQTSGNASSPAAIRALQNSATPGMDARPDDTAVNYTNTITAVSVFLLAHVSIAAEVIAISAVAVGAVLVVAVTPCDPRICHNTDAVPVGNIAKLDPALVKGAETAVRMSRMMGAPAFELQVARDMLSRELEAIINATESVGIVALASGEKQRLLEQCTDAAGRALGLA